MACKTQGYLSLGLTCSNLLGGGFFVWTQRLSRPSNLHNTAFLTADLVAHRNKVEAVSLVSESLRSPRSGACSALRQYVVRSATVRRYLILDLLVRFTKLY